MPDSNDKTDDVNEDDNDHDAFNDDDDDTDDKENVPPNPYCRPTLTREIDQFVRLVNGPNSILTCVEYSRSAKITIYVDSTIVYMSKPK